MAVKDSTKVLVGDELRQLALQGKFDLAAPLSELGIDEGEAESAIDAGLVAADQCPPLVQTVVVQPHSLFRRQRLELRDVSGGACGEEKGGAEMLAIGQADLQSVRWPRLRRPPGFRRFRNEREMTDEFATAAKVAGNRDALQLGPGLTYGILGVFEQDRGTMQMEAAFPTFRDRQVLQDLAL